MPLVADPNNIRLAMLGMVEGNGHPYSWSAIINGGFDADAMAKCPYPVIPQYLSAQPKSALGIPGARVTHVWCDNPDDAEHVAAASLIPNIARNPREVIGQVDAVIIATDIGHEHLERARPFVEEGLPVFIDKPLTDREDHLRQFAAWQSAGKRIMSSSAMRYAREYADLKSRLGEIGELRAITVTMCKTWERYGIHALEAVYPLLEPGKCESVMNSGDAGSNIVHLHYPSAPDVIVLNVIDLYSAFGHVHCYGTAGAIAAIFKDTFTAFKAQLEDFVGYLRSGVEPFPFSQTIELMKMVIAGTQSRLRCGERVFLRHIRVD